MLEIFPDVSFRSGFQEMQMLAMIAGFGIGFVCVIGLGGAFFLGRCQWSWLSFFFKRIDTSLSLNLVNIVLERCFF